MIKRTGLVKPADMKIMSVWLKVYELLNAFLQLLITPFKDSFCDGVRYPSLAKRFGAWFLDILFVAIGAYLIVTISSPWIDAIGDRMIAALFEFLLNLILVFLYFLVSAMVWRKSPGKFMFGVGIMSFKSRTIANHAQATWLQAGSREVFKLGLLPLVPILFVLMLFSKRRRSLWDQLSNTVVGYVDRID